MVVDSSVATKNSYGLYSYQTGTGSVATIRAGESVLMNNGTNLSAGNGSFLVSYGGNRVGSAGGNTGFTSTEAQQ
jgi:hypothetical protein